MNRSERAKKRFVQEQGSLILNSLKKINKELFSGSGQIYFYDLSVYSCCWEMDFYSGRILSINYDSQGKENNDKVNLNVRLKGIPKALTEFWFKQVSINSDFENTLVYFLQGKI